MRCPNCSAEMRATSKVCGYCGTRLEAAPQVVVPEEVAPEEPVVADEVATTERHQAGWLSRHRAFVVVSALVAVGAAVTAVLLTRSSDDTEKAGESSVATTGAPIRTTVPAIGDIVFGVPVAAMDELSGWERLDLLPAQLSDDSSANESYTCEVIGTEELPDGTRDLFMCTGEGSTSSSRVVVSHGHFRDDRQSVEDVVAQGSYFDLAVDGVATEPDAYLKWDGNRAPVATFVYFLELHGRHSLTAVWYEFGVPTITTVTEVDFP